MTEQYLRNATSDAITGAVSACEGIANSLVLLNGPLGCKFYYGFGGIRSIGERSDLWGLRGELRLRDAIDEKLLRSQFFVGTPHTPGTNLRYSDYIFGTREQLRRALNDIFASHRYELFTVIQTPGTSLLGEALENELQEISEEYDIPYLFLESPALSENALLGYDSATVRLLDLLTPKLEQTERQRPRVNLFGFDSHEKYPEGGANEIRRLLNLSGIDTHAIVGLNCPMDTFRTLSDADAHILLCPERCSKTGDYLRSHYAVPVLETGGMPIGFDLTEKFIRDVCDLVGADPAPALADIDHSRANAFYYIAKTLGGSGFPRDLRYAAEGEPSLLCGYVDYLSGYLGIKPKAIHPLYPQCSRAGEQTLREMLRAYRSEEALSYDIAQADDVLLLAAANTIVHSNAYNHNIFGIETANPGSGYIHVIPKTHIGCAGAMYLLEQVLNGNKLLHAWNE